MRTPGAALALCLLPLAAAAQTPASQGPMVVEEVHNSFMSDGAVGSIGLQIGGGS